MRINYRLFLFCFWGIFISELSAQTIIEGVVTNKQDGNPISAAIVTINNSAGTESHAYGFTDSKGKYHIAIRAKEDSICVVFISLGYETQTFELPNKNKTLDVALESMIFQLKEVTIRPPDISLREDTLNFRVDAFVREGDRNIGDVLRRLPGMNVTSNGSIKYNGENINNYYIEGLNLLGNKYSIANNNISPEDILNIQIIENHQPIKAMKDVFFSEQAAINLQLKKDKIAKPTGKIELGTGLYPALWNLNTFAMQIGKKRQTIVTYKTNNTGKDIAADLNPHSLTIDNITSGNAMVPGNLITLPLLSSPPTKESRYLFNNTHIVSINHLQKTGNDSQLRVNISYLKNEQKQKLNEKSSYYFASTDTSLVIDESNTLNNYTNQADAELTYTHNSKRQYINNTLKFSGIWNSTKSSLTGSENLNQTFYTPLFYVQNDWEMIKKIQSRMFQFSSFIRYSNLPQQLAVKADSITEAVVQIAHLGNFHTSNSTAYGFLWRQSNLRFDFNMQAFLDDLNSSVKNSPLFSEIDNHIKFNKWIYKITPKYNYKSRKLDFDLSVPVSFNDLFVNDILLNTRQNFTFLFANPSVSIDYKWTPLWHSDISFNYKDDIGDIIDFTGAYIMNNYRSFYRGSGILSHRTSQSYRFKINYRDPIEALFFNVGVSYRRTKSNLLSKTDFRGTYSLSDAVESDRVSEYQTVTGSISKYIRTLQTTFSIQSNYIVASSQQIQQGSILTSENRIFMLRPKIDVRISNELNFVYNVDFTNNKMRIKSVEIDNPALNQIYHFLSINVFPSKRWMMRTRLEYYQNQLSADSYSRLFFADIGLTCKTKNIDYSLDCTNIFNHRSYAYIQYDGPNIFSHHFNLRPINILFNTAFKF